MSAEVVTFPKRRQRLQTKRAPVGDAAPVAHYKPALYYFRLGARQLDSNGRDFALALIGELEAARTWAIETFHRPPPRRIAVLDEMRDKGDAAGVCDQDRWNDGYTRPPCCDHFDSAS